MCMFVTCEKVFRKLEIWSTNQQEPYVKVEEQYVKVFFVTNENLVMLVENFERTLLADDNLLIS